MKRFRLISFIFCFSIINTGNAQIWEIQDSGINNNLNDVYFIDEFHGWAIGENSAIIATTDGGNNWQIQSSPIDSVVFEHVQFVNESVGYIVGYKDYPYYHGIILSTNNGGNTWAISKVDTIYEFNDLSFINPDTGWVVGSNDFTRTGVILQTVDGGQTWNTQLETYSQSIFSSTMFTAVEFIDENNGWAFGGDYVDNFSHTSAYRTTDAGVSWNIIGEVSSVIYEIDIASLDTIWCGGWWGFDISTNGGVDWISIDDGSDIVTNQDVELLNGHIGWYIGATFTGSKIRYTENAALSWTEILTDQIPWLNSIYALETDLIWVVGDSGIVMHYSSDSLSVVPEIENISQSFILKQNYPNPYNPLTSIRFELPEESLVVLKIYDLMGREVNTLINKTENVGFKNIIWDSKDKNGRPVPSGMYFYRLDAVSKESDKKFHETRKMVLMR